MVNQVVGRKTIIELPYSRSDAWRMPSVTQPILESGLHRISAAAMPEEAGNCSEHRRRISYKGPLRKRCVAYAL